jgi:hypothetical protein
VERAKAQLKASLLLGLDGTTAIAEDIGRQLVTAGKRYTPQEIQAAIDSIGVQDIQRVARTTCGMPTLRSPPTARSRVSLTTTASAPTSAA